MRALLLGRRKDDAPGALRHVDDARGRGHGPLREGQGSPSKPPSLARTATDTLSWTHPLRSPVSQTGAWLSEGRGDADADPADGLLPQGVLDDVGEGIRSLDVVAEARTEVRPHLGRICPECAPTRPYRRASRESPSASMPSNGMGIVTLCPATVRATTSFGRGAVFVSSSMATTVKVDDGRGDVTGRLETV